MLLYWIKFLYLNCAGSALKCSETQVRDIPSLDLELKKNHDNSSWGVCVCVCVCRGGGG